MKKYILNLIILVLILTSCSSPQQGHNYNHHYKHKGFDYKKHNRYQRKMVNKMKRVNRHQGKTYFMIQNLPEGYFRDSKYAYGVPQECY